MSEQAFWSVIERARQPKQDFEETVARVEEILRESTPDAIVEFERGSSRLMERSYKWTLWGAAYLINGGCSDDGFDYFRGWLLTQGREVFEAALADPDTLAAVVDEEVECEDMLYVGARAYEAVVGEEIPRITVDYSDLGEGWDFDDAEEMARRYPKLWAKFGWDGEAEDDDDE